MAVNENKGIKVEREGMIYCKKCGAWVVPEFGECPRCGYRLEGNSRIVVYILVGLILLVFAVIILF